MRARVGALLGELVSQPDRLAGSDSDRWVDVNVVLRDGCVRIDVVGPVMGMVSAARPDRDAQAAAAPAAYELAEEACLMLRALSDRWGSYGNEGYASWFELDQPISHRN
jgi:hypothetical protein